MTEYKGHKHDFYLTENVYLLKNGTAEIVLSAPHETDPNSNTNIVTYIRETIEKENNKNIISLDSNVKYKIWLCNDNVHYKIISYTLDEPFAKLGMKILLINNSNRDFVIHPDKYQPLITMYINYEDYSYDVLPIFKTNLNIIEKINYKLFCQNIFGIRLGLDIISVCLLGMSACMIIMKKL